MHNLVIVVSTYYQDDQDAQHHAIQDDSLELIQVEYSLDDISKTETPIVIEEDEKLMVYDNACIRCQQKTRA